MTVVFLTILLFLIAMYLNKFVKKYFVILTIIFTILSLASYLFFDVSNIINKGHLGLAFLFIAMLATAFKKGSKLRKNTILIRKEYSIFSFIFILPHCIIYLFGKHQDIEWIGVIAFIIMIPLFITSFHIIRNKMSYKNWKYLHLLSYPAYLLTFIHLIIVGEGKHTVISILLLILYIILKIKNDRFQNIKRLF